MRSTHTYAILEISEAAYREIKEKLEAADYRHAFMPGGEIDLTGVAVQAESAETKLTLSSGKSLDRDGINSVAKEGRITVVSSTAPEEPLAEDGS